MPPRRCARFRDTRVLTVRAGTTRPNVNHGPLPVKKLNTTNLDNNMMYSLGGRCACKETWAYQGDVFHGCAETSDWPGNNWCYVEDPSCVLASESIRAGTTATHGDSVRAETGQDGLFGGRLHISVR